MSAKQQAIKDIKNELKGTSKSFIAFHSELNSIMRQLVSKQLAEQRKKH